MWGIVLPVPWLLRIRIEAKAFSISNQPLINRKCSLVSNILAANTATQIEINSPTALMWAMTW